MIIITGASGGLGSYLVEHLGGQYDVVGTYNSRKPAGLDQAAELHQVDVSDADSVELFVNSLADRLTNITLINMAGISLDGFGHKLPEATWDQVMDTNIKGAFLMSRAVLPLMREQQWGRIINVSSVVGQMGVPGTAAYSASKSALFGLTRTLAIENATKNVTVNCLALGYFEAGMINEVRPEVQEQVKAKIPMQHFGHPRNVGLAVRFLMDSDYTTGSVININGGLL